MEMMKRLTSVALLSIAGIWLLLVSGLHSEKAAHPIPSPRGGTAGRLIGFDPRTELEVARRLEERSERDFRVRELLHTWAMRRPDEALDWSDGIPDAAERKSARSMICLAVAEDDPQRAVELALKHRADADDTTGLLECLAMQWSGKEPDAALEWASGQPTGPWRDRLVSRSAWMLSKTDPVAAAGWVADMEPGPLQEEAAMAILHQWALQDAEAASRWAADFPEGSLRERALREISGIRSRMDPGVRSQ